MRKLIPVLLAVSFLVPTAALAQNRPAYTELNPAQQVESTGKIEVLEFFWYGCIHCYNLEPALERWLGKLPADVNFRRVPAVFNDRMARDAAIFYSFEALGIVDKVHRPFFDAIHRDRLRIDNTAALSEWLQKQGIDPQKFTDTMKSFGVQSKSRRAALMTSAYKIDGTPAMAVHGRYTVAADQVRSQEGMLQSVSNLVELVRKKK